jgi:prevent-host-death family protein
MVSIGAFEAKTHLSKLLQRVSAGEQFTITIHGLPVAKLVPVASDEKLTPQEAIDQLRALSSGTSLAGISVRELIAEGRKH